MPNLSSLEGQTNKCRYDTEENGALQPNRSTLHAVALSFQTFTKPAYVNAFFWRARSDE